MHKKRLLWKCIVSTFGHENGTPTLHFSALKPLFSACFMVVRQGVALQQGGALKQGGLQTGCGSPAPEIQYDNVLFSRKRLLCRFPRKTTLQKNSISQETAISAPCFTTSPGIPSTHVQCATVVGNGYGHPGSRLQITPHPHILGGSVHPHILGGRTHPRVHAGGNASLTREPGRKGTCSVHWSGGATACRESGRK